jgi:metallo-beta-lactamase family protein
VAEITFVGAAGTVTGSKHLLTVGGKHVFVDCGLFQGVVDVRALNDEPLPVPAREIAAVIITHGHLDHVGYLPRLVHDGFAGPIYCTPPTQAVMGIVLDDAAHLQQELQERGFQHQRPYAPPVYYNQRDVDSAKALAQPRDLHAPFDVAGVVKATYYNAGHILGSAFAALEFEGKRAIFSGDLGRYDRPLLFDPEPIGAADAVVCESTYADRVHPREPLEALRDALLAGIERGGAIVIPAFAIERTQDLLLAIAELQAQDAKLAAIPVHLDSPMAEKVDDVFEAFPGWHKPFANDSAAHPFGIRNLTIHVTAEESKQLNHVHGPHVIISSSGMASGGRILHHLHNHLSDPAATIIFAGYQSAGTLGYILTHNPHTINLYGDSLPVKAALVHLSGFSGHADRDELKRWLETCTSKPHLYAVHGEAESAAALAAMANTALGWKADVAQRGTTVTL